MRLPRINLHSHTKFSDGKSNIQYMVKSAINSNLDYFAITDHFSNALKSKIIPVINSHELIDEYLSQIETCQTYLKINSYKMRLLKGIEIDLGSSEQFIKNLINPIKFDLILFEYLESPEGLAFIKSLIEFWKNQHSLPELPIFGLAHFDPSLFISMGLSRLIQILKQYNIYFEFNTSYSEYYSRKNHLFFENMKAYNILVAIGSDAHIPGQIRLIEEELETIQEYELQNNYLALINILESKGNF